MTLRRYNESTTFYRPLSKDGSYLTSSPTLASGDFKIQKDGGVPVNLSSIPTFISGTLNIALTSSEMQCQEGMIKLVDQTNPKEWDDDAIVFNTYGNSSSEHQYIGRIFNIDSNNNIDANIKSFYDRATTIVTHDGDDETSGQSLISAISGASDNTLVFVGPGEYNISYTPITFSGEGVSIIGSDKSTVIKGATSGTMIYPVNKTLFKDMVLRPAENVSGFLMSACSLGNGDNEAQNVTFKNVKFTQEPDSLVFAVGISIGTSGICDFAVEDCEFDLEQSLAGISINTEFNEQKITVENTNISLENCVPSFLNSVGFLAYGDNEANILLKNTNIYIPDASGTINPHVACVENAGDDITIILHNCGLYSSNVGPGRAYDIINSGNGQVISEDTNYITSSGTVTVSAGAPVSANIVQEYGRTIDIITHTGDDDVSGSGLLSAINNAPDYSIVRIGPGVFNIGRNQIKPTGNYIDIVGSGPATLIRSGLAYGTGYPSGSCINPSDNSTWRDFSFAGSFSLGFGEGIAMFGSVSGAVVEDRFDDVRVENVTAHTFSDRSATDLVSLLRIERGRNSALICGIEFNNVSCRSAGIPVIINDNFNGATDPAVGHHDIVFKNCDIIGTTYAGFNSSVPGQTHKGKRATVVSDGDSSRRVKFINCNLGYDDSVGNVVSSFINNNSSNYQIFEFINSDMSCRINPSGTEHNYDIINHGASGQVLLKDCSFLTSSGYITEITKNNTILQDTHEVQSQFTTMTQLDGSVYRFTENALELAPQGSGAGGGSGTSDWTTLEKEQIRYRLKIDGGSATAPTGISFAFSYPDINVKEVVDQIAVATGPIDFDNLDETVSSRSSHSTANVWSYGTRTLTSGSYTSGLFSYYADQQGITSARMANLDNISGIVLAGPTPGGSTVGAQLDLAGTASGTVTLDSNTVVKANVTQLNGMSVVSNPFRVNVSSPLANDQTLTLVTGDNYKFADGTHLSYQVDGFSLTLSSVTLAIRDIKDDIDMLTDVSGVVTTSSGTLEFYFELSNSQTSGFIESANRYRYDIEGLTTNGFERTLVRGKVTVYSGLNI